MSDASSPRSLDANPLKPWIGTERLEFRVNVDRVEERGVLVERAIDLPGRVRRLPERIVQNGHVQSVGIVALATMFDLVEDGARVRGPSELDEARRLEGPRPRQIAGHDGANLVLGQRLLQTSG